MSTEKYEVERHTLWELDRMSIITQDASQRNVFARGELVMWHYRDRNKQVPVSAVVLGQESGGIVIKARVQGMLKEFRVEPKELVSR